MGAPENLLEGAARNINTPDIAIHAQRVERFAPAIARDSRGVIRQARYLTQLPAFGRFWQRLKFIGLAELRVGLELCLFPKSLYLVSANDAAVISPTVQYECEHVSELLIV